MSTLSSDKFNLLVLVDETYNYIIVKCKVSLKIAVYSKNLVTWYYKVKVSSNEEQLEFYNKILDTDMSNLLMSALTNDIGHINKLEEVKDSDSETGENQCQIKLPGKFEVDFELDENGNPTFIIPMKDGIMKIYFQIYQRQIVLIIKLCEI